MKGRSPSNYPTPPNVDSFVDLASCTNHHKNPGQDSETKNKFTRYWRQNYPNDTWALNNRKSTNILHYNHPDVIVPLNRKRIHKVKHDFRVIK